MKWKPVKALLFAGAVGACTTAPTAKNEFGQRVAIVEIAGIDHRAPERKNPLDQQVEDAARAVCYSSFRGPLSLYKQSTCRKNSQKSDIVGFYGSVESTFALRGSGND